MRFKRYIVSGLMDSVPVCTRYVSLPAAKKFADKLKLSEVYDTITKSYVYGNSYWIQENVKIVSNAR